MEGISFQKPETPGLVSVVIPTRRGERFIGQTLESVGRQLYRKWEVIVVEDGSNGGTEAIVKAFARRHPWHRVDYSRNDQSCGAAYTRNVAFTRSRGEYVALLDSDDRWFPDHLSVSVEAFVSTETDIVYSTVLMIEDQSELLLGVWGPSPGELGGFPQSIFQRNFVTPSATVMRRQVLADVGPWDTFYRYCEDYGYWMRCIAAGKQFHCIGGCHCLYRKNHDGATTQRLCGTLEEAAETTERYMNMPGLRVKQCRNDVAAAFFAAGEHHAKSNPLCDSSADPSRAVPLMMKAWRLRPEKLEYLWKAVNFKARNSLRPKNRKPLVGESAQISGTIELSTTVAESTVERAAA